MSTKNIDQATTVGPPETGAAGLHAPSSSGPQNARNGKIARLPLAVRTELNQRLRNGETGAELLTWLFECCYGPVHLVPELAMPRWRQPRNGRQGKRFPS
jgi:hypothetical protein